MSRERMMTRMMRDDRIEAALKEVVPTVVGKRKRKPTEAERLTIMREVAKRVKLPTASVSHVCYNRLTMLMRNMGLMEPFVERH